MQQNQSPEVVETPSTVARSTGRKLDSKAFSAILGARKLIKLEHIGRQVSLFIQGKGQYLPQGYQFAGATGLTENAFSRTIYNVAANSQLAMLRPENKAILTEAMKAESAGDTDAAHDLFNEYLNAVQVSFSVIEPSNRQFTSGNNVTAIVAEYTNPNTQVRSLVINDIRYVPPVELEAVKFSITDLINA